MQEKRDSGKNMIMTTAHAKLQRTNRVSIPLMIALSLSPPNVSTYTTSPPTHIPSSYLTSQDRFASSASNSTQSRLAHMTLRTPLPLISLKTHRPCKESHLPTAMHIWITQMIKVKTNRYTKRVLLEMQIMNMQPIALYDILRWKSNQNTLCDGIDIHELSTRSSLQNISRNIFTRYWKRMNKQKIN